MLAEYILLDPDMSRTETVTLQTEAGLHPFLGTAFPCPQDHHHLPQDLGMAGTEANEFMSKYSRMMITLLD